MKSYRAVLDCEMCDRIYELIACARKFFFEIDFTAKEFRFEAFYFLFFKKVLKIQTYFTWARPIAILRRRGGPEKGSDSLEPKKWHPL